MTDKEQAEAYREAAKWLDSEEVSWTATIAEMLRTRADKLDPPKVDRSLRGWVILEAENGRQTVFYADHDGLNTDSRCEDDEWDWGQLVSSTCTVRPLTAADLSVEAYTVEEIRRVFREDSWIGVEEFLDYIRANREAKHE